MQTSKKECSLPAGPLFLAMRHLTECTFNLEIRLNLALRTDTHEICVRSLYVRKYVI